MLFPARARRAASRALLTVFVVGALLAAAPAVASAAIVSNVNGGVLEIEGQPNFANWVTLTSGAPGEVIVSNPGHGPSHGGTDCTPSGGANPISSTCVGVTSIEIAMGAEDDRLFASALTEALAITVFGDAGMDVLQTGPGVDSVDGGDGDDFLHGSASNDTWIGGAGTDAMFHTWDAPATTVVDGTLSSNAGHSESFSTVEVVQVTGGAGANSMDGSDFTAGAVQFNGMGGEDSLVGSPQGDLLEGGDGIDTLDPGLGAAQSVVGGDGIDTVVFDVPAGSLGANGTTIGVAGSVIDHGEIEHIQAVMGDGGDSSVDMGTFAGTADITTGDGEDTVYLPLDGSVVDTGAGDDSISGGPDSDVIDGGADDDRLYEDIQSGAAVLDGTEFRQANSVDSIPNIESAWITGSIANNTFDASGFAGTLDYVTGGGSDVVVPTAQDDTIACNFSDETQVIEHGDVDMHVSGTFFATTVTGGLGTDQLQMCQVELVGGPSANMLSVGATYDAGVEIAGGYGDDTLVGGPENDVIRGGEGTDTYVATASGPFVLKPATAEGHGTDLLSSVEGAQITGGGLADSINATAFSGSATLIGGGGNDVLRSGAGEDDLQGNDGNDTLTGGAEDDDFDGGAGTDRLVETANASMTITATTLTGVGADDLASINAATLTGGTGNNTIVGTTFPGPLTLFGLGGNDILIGGAFADLLYGGDGNDTLEGKGAADALRGEAGADLLKMRDDTRDAFVDCGTTAGDRAVLDTNDPTQRGCESVSRA